MSEIPGPSLRELKAYVAAAAAELRARDLPLFEVEAHERAITHRLALYLERFFPRWHVDCEYNRQMGKLDVAEFMSKRLDLPNRKPRKSEGSLVLPDIIVHKRRAPRNLLVIEVKVAWGGPDDDDLEKLKVFVSPDTRLEVRYTTGVFLRFDQEGLVAREEWWRMGERVPDRT